MARSINGYKPARKERSELIAAE